MDMQVLRLPNALFTRLSRDSNVVLGIKFKAFNFQIEELMAPKWTRIITSAIEFMSPYTRPKKSMLAVLNHIISTLTDCLFLL